MSADPDEDFSGTQSKPSDVLWNNKEKGQIKNRGPEIQDIEQRFDFYPSSTLIHKACLAVNFPIWSYGISIDKCTVELVSKQYGCI